MNLRGEVAVDRSSGVGNGMPDNGFKRVVMEFEEFRRAAMKEFDNRYYCSFLMHSHIYKTVIK